MGKMTDYEKEVFRARIREIIRSRGLDPDTIDIEGIVENPDGKLELPNGETLAFVEVATPDQWGPFMRAFNFFGAGIGKIVDDMNTDFSKAEATLETDKREDLAHEAVHVALDKLFLLAALLKPMMPCVTAPKQEGNAPTCNTVQ